MSRNIYDTGVTPKSARLEGKRVALGVCGGIGSVETVKIIRELRRNGARVTVFLSPMALKFITELSLEWASSEKVVTSEGAEVEYLGPFDLVLIAPATLNTITKSALAVADSAVSLLIASHLGSRKPLLFVPTMNVQMQEHPKYLEYVATLEKWGADFFPTEVEEGRLKMPSPTAVSEWVLKKIS